LLCCTLLFATTKIAYKKGFTGNYKDCLFIIRDLNPSLITIQSFLINNPCSFMITMWYKFLSQNVAEPVANRLQQKYFYYDGGFPFHSYPPYNESLAIHNSQFTIHNYLGYKGILLSLPSCNTSIKSLWIRTK